MMDVTGAPQGGALMVGGEATIDWGQTLACADLPVCMLDGKGRILWRNAGYERRFAVSERPGFVVWAHTHAPADLMTMLDSIYNGKGWQGELQEVRDGGRLCVLVTLVPVQSASGRALAFLTDVTEIREDAESARKNATRDRLTGLANRASFDDMMEFWVKQTKRTNSLSALLLVDLDGFKQVNDTHGHDAGDIVLKECARRIRAVVRESDFVARFGGDEFGCLLSQLTTEAEAGAVADRMVAALRQPIVWPRGSAQVGASIGIATFGTTDVGKCAEIFKEADNYLYAAKNGGKNGWRASYVDHYADRILKPIMPPKKPGE